MKMFYKRHASTILTVIGGLGVVVTSVSAVKATPKAMRLLEETEKQKGEELTTIEKIKTAGPVYIPSILIGVGTVGCIVGANVLNKRQQAALVSAYTLIDNSYKEYKQKVKELYGEETHQEILDSIAAEKAEKLQIRGNYLGSECDLSTDEYEGEPVLFYDEFSGRYFISTMEQVLSAEYHMNRNYVLRGMAYLNELYEFLGISGTDYGSVMGWAPMDEGEYWLEFHHRKTKVKGIDCYILEMPFEPTYEPWDDY